VGKQTSDLARSFTRAIEFDGGAARPIGRKGTVVNESIVQQKAVNHPVGVVRVELGAGRGG